jgi:hypothetical protein
MTVVNRQITLAARPSGYPRVSDFQLVYRPLPAPEAGEALVRALYLSLDPGLREPMNASSATPLSLGDVMPAAVVAVVLRSLDASLEPGDVVEGMLGWQEYAAADTHLLRRIEPDAAPFSTALGVLGTPGLTAFLGLLDLCDPQPGETVVVSEAAGAVGMLAGQIARIRGCRVVGVANSDTMAAWLFDELSLDAAVNSRSQDLEGALAESCPRGVDVYFDNVGGALSDAVFRRINSHARIAVCGQLSQINLEVPELGPRFLGRLISQQASMYGFLLVGFSERFADARKQMASWLAQGQLKYYEEIAQGIESAPQAFIGMLHGRNQGKQLVQISEM